VLRFLLSTVSPVGFLSILRVSGSADLVARFCLRFFLCRDFVRALFDECVRALSALERLSHSESIAPAWFLSAHEQSSRPAFDFSSLQVLTLVAGLRITPSASLSFSRASRLKFLPPRVSISA
jgi:hypothetical protein